jgi:hypothetical protein
VCRNEGSPVCQNTVISVCVDGGGGRDRRPVQRTYYIPPRVGEFRTIPHPKGIRQSSEDNCNANFRVILLGGSGSLFNVQHGIDWDMSIARST